MSNMNFTDFEHVNTLSNKVSSLKNKLSKEPKEQKQTKSKDSKK